MSVMRSALLGTVSGAVGTVALNVATYADIAARGRPLSGMPATLVKNVALATHVDALAGDDSMAANRRTGVGSLLGLANGLGLGAAYGAVRPTLPRRFPLLLLAAVVGGAAMALSDVPATKAHATDPSTWGASGWIADVLPHLAFGYAVVRAFDYLDARAGKA